MLYVCVQDIFIYLHVCGILELRILDMYSEVKNFNIVSLPVFGTHENYMFQNRLVMPHKIPLVMLFFGDFDFS